MASDPSRTYSVTVVLLPSRIVPQRVVPIGRGKTAPVVAKPAFSRVETQ
jgi:hypothetical protein